MLRAAVVARANTAARADPRCTVQQRLRQFAYGRLLARVFTFEPESWVLKAGVSLLARPPGARHSLDVDLWGRQRSLAEAERAVELASAVDLGDFTSFDVGRLERGELGRQGLTVPAEFAVPDAVAWEVAYRAYAEALPTSRALGSSRRWDW